MRSIRASRLGSVDASVGGAEVRDPQLHQCLQHQPLAPASHTRITDGFIYFVIALRLYSSRQTVTTYDSVMSVVPNP